jgi:hypothetical protein
MRRSSRRPSGLANAADARFSLRTQVLGVRTSDGACLRSNHRSGRSQRAAPERSSTGLGRGMTNWKPPPRGSAAGPSRPGRMPGGSGRPSQTGTPIGWSTTGWALSRHRSGERTEPVPEQSGNGPKEEETAGVSCGKRRSRRNRLADIVPLPGLRCSGRSRLLQWRVSPLHCPR